MFKGISEAIDFEFGKFVSQIISIYPLLYLVASFGMKFCCFFPSRVLLKTFCKIYLLNNSCCSTQDNTYVHIWGVSLSKIMEIRLRKVHSTLTKSMYIVYQCKIILHYDSFPLQEAPVLVMTHILNIIVCVGEGGCVCALSMQCSKAIVSSTHLVHIPQYIQCMLILQYVCCTN